MAMKVCLDRMKQQLKSIFAFVGMNLDLNYYSRMTKRMRMDLAKMMVEAVVAIESAQKYTCRR
jgi:hypothetical protein